MSFEIREIGKEERQEVWRRRSLLIITTIAKPLLGLYAKWKARQQKEEKHTHRIMLLKRVIAIASATLIVLVLLITVASAFFRMQFSLRSLLTVAATELPVDANGYTNFLLLGTGDDDHEGVDLIDTIIVASIDKKTKNAVLLSLPRDLYFMKTEKMGVGRINSLYRDYKYALIHQGKSKEAASKESLDEFAQEVSDVLGLKIHRYAKVNFTAFQEIVDAIGGVDIMVPEDIVDPEYPGPNYTYETFSISKGLHHMDGSTALKYARTRHSTSDFSRSARQQQIIIAAAEKAKNSNLIKKPSTITHLIASLSKNIETDLSLSEMLSLAPLAEDMKPSDVVTVQLNAQNGLYGTFIEKGGFLYGPPRDQFEGAAVLLPVSLPEFPITWKQIQSFAALIFTHRDLLLHPASIAVLNAGGKEGLARSVGGELYRYNFDIVDMENYKNGTFDDSFIAVRSSPDDDTTPHQATVDYLTSLLKLKSMAWPENLELKNDADIIIVLGKNFAYTPLQNLIPPLNASDADAATDHR